MLDTDKCGGVLPFRHGVWQVNMAMMAEVLTLCSGAFAPGV